MGTRIVIIGAGYAGVETALRLNKLKKKNDLEITLIDKNDYHTLLTELHEVAGNRVSEEAVRIPLNRIFKFTDVNIVRDEITSYDMENNKVASETREYEYDYLVLSMGSTPNFFGIPGLEEHAYTLWSFDDAVRIREHIKECFALASSEDDPEKRKSLLTFAVGGAGFTGVEMVGELAHWSKSLAQEWNIDQDEIRLILVDMLPRILNTLGEDNAKKAHEYMEEKLGVEMMLETPIQESTPEGFKTDKGFVNTKTLIYACGVRAASDVDEMPIEKPNRSQRLGVDEYCRTEEFENVYAAGDVSGLSDEEGKQYPAMVENAVQTGDGVAENIVKDINNQEQEKVEVKMHGTMVSVGNYFAVSEIMGKKFPVWLSIIMKFLVNIHYLWEITGFWGVANYLRHEILERRQRKHFFEKHYTTRVQAWWTVPVRIFLGLIWLIEGIKKVSEGWLSSPKLAQFLGYATDSTTSATEAGGVTKSIEELFNLKLHIVNFMVGKENTVVDGTEAASALFAKMELFHIGNFNLVPWFLQNIVLANDTIAMIFQVLVVLLELGIGLMLMGGAFTFIASVISAGLMMMFFTSTGVYELTWWMFFASFATMGGAGRAFGLDYYLMPYITNVWEYFWKNRKLKLFFKGSLKRPKH